ncbi:MAG: VanZ family protein [Candidatus Omnitrophica bacterium]|nr:VanZ family protein [Candidatus Omnitrophota bacterium]
MNLPSKRTIFIAAGIILSASFTRQLMDFTEALIGKSGFALVIGLVALSGILIFLSLIGINHLSGIRFVSVFLLLIAGPLLSWFYITLPQVRMHILLYGFLGWSACVDFLGKKRTALRIICAILLCVLVGYLEELFQLILPYRYYDNWDVVLNSLGSLWGIALYLLGKKK